MDGTTVRGDEVEFRLWAPAAHRVELRLERIGSDPEMIEMRRLGSADFGLPDFDLPDTNTWEASGVRARAGDHYSYIVDGSKPLPDPVSRLLPEGVHGCTEIVDPNRFTWTDTTWHGLDIRDYVLYELHIGTFTAEGTFDAAIMHLPYLRDLGVTAIEVMPVNAFPGRHNWGYDGVGLYAVQSNYGGPEGFRRFVDAAHQHGLAVVLDVVYNHLGNEGNYLRNLGPYFTAKHQTPWGEAVNFDDEGSQGVRRFFVNNALYWLREYHLDGLRLDAVHTIKDDSKLHIVAEIQNQAEALARESGRTICIIAETDENDPRYVLPPEKNGYGLAGIWSDDFHHAVHAYITGEDKGYYRDFGAREQITKALNEGFVFQGEFFKYWNDVRGSSPEGVPMQAHVINLQNHDQVGNRALGERITALMPRGARFLTAALLLLAPHTPLIFMGQEYDEKAPFQFFTDYGDPVLQHAVSEGRRKEFAEFDWKDVPDPQDHATFERSRLRWDQSRESVEMLSWYRDLLRLRREFVTHAGRDCCAEWAGANTLFMRVPDRSARLLVVARFGGQNAWAPGKTWREALAHDEDGYAVKVYVRA